MSSALAELERGSRISHYRLEGLLGESPTGALYRASDTVLDREAVIRFFDWPGQRLAGLREEWSHRLLRRLRVLSRLRHPNLVQLYEADFSGETPFAIFEFIAGESLADYLEGQGQVPLPQACEFIWQIARGLDSAWREQRLHHGHLRPSRILLDHDHNVKIRELGLPGDWRLDQPETLADESWLDDPEFTREALFLAPEQALFPTGLDLRSDIYALGLLLFRLLAGRLPFGETGARELFAAKQAGLRVLPSHSTPGLSPVADHLVNLALAADPAARLGSYPDLLALLTAVLQGKNMGELPVELLSPIWAPDGTAEDQLIAEADAAESEDAEPEDEPDPAVAQNRSRFADETQDLPLPVSPGWNPATAADDQTGTAAEPDDEMPSLPVPDYLKPPDLDDVPLETASLALGLAQLASSAAESVQDTPELPAGPDPGRLKTAVLAIKRHRGEPGQSELHVSLARPPRLPSARPISQRMAAGIRHKGGPLRLQPAFGVEAVEDLLASLPVPTELAQYRLERLIGVGSVGAVFRARDLELDQDVAIKCLIPPPGLNHDQRMQLLQAQLLPLAEALHPAIVPDLGAGLADHPSGPQIAYRVMELALGGQLQPLTMADYYGTLHVEDVVASQHELAAILSYLLEAIDLVHRQGGVHAGLTPRNVLLQFAEGASEYLEVRPRLTDFATARLVGEAHLHELIGEALAGPRGDEAPVYVRRRQENYLFASPEQRRGGPATPASDLYSLGAMALWALTGGSTDGEWILERLPPGLRPGWDEIIATAMHPLPERRYASAAAMLADFQDLAG